MVHQDGDTALVYRNVMKKCNAIRRSTHSLQGTISHLSKLHDGLHVHFVLLHLLPEPDGLLHLCRVDVLGPSTFTVIHATVLHLIPDCVHLEEGENVCVCACVCVCVCRGGGGVTATYI